MSVFNRQKAQLLLESAKQLTDTNTRSGHFRKHRVGFISQKKQAKRYLAFGDALLIDCRAFREDHQMDRIPGMFF
jgi:hypothetical protein